MKLNVFALVIGFASLVGACTIQDNSKSADQEQFGASLSASQCSGSAIDACTNSGGGLECFKRCSIQPSAKYCEMTALDKCIANRGGAACYKEHCDAGSGGSVGSGPFNPGGGGGLTRIPSAGPGYECYDVEWMRYGTPRTIARIQELAKRVFRKTGYKIFVGDMSASDGSNGGRHAGHSGGVEVDIAIMGNTPSVMCYNITDGCYDRSAQITLVNEALAMGGISSIYFNDSSVINRFPGIVSWSTGHDNHIHFNWDQ